MNFNPDIHHRKSLRLKNYDYSQNGAYFITICVQNKENLFGDISNGNLKLNDPGEMIFRCWMELLERFSNIKLDEFIIMPNHIHGIIFINGIPNFRAGTRPAPTINTNENVGAPLVGAQNNNTQNHQIIKNNNYQNVGAPLLGALSIGNIIGTFKSITTNEYIRNVKQNNWQPFNSRIWHRNYYEHIIRNDISLNEIREYIVNNPANWEKDELYI